MSVPTSQTLEVTGDGFIVSHSSDGSTWTTIAEIVEIAIGGRKVNKVPTPNLGMISRTSQPSKIPDSQQFEFQANFNATVFATLDGFQTAGTFKQWRIMANDSVGGTHPTTTPSTATGSNVIGFGYISELNPFGNVAVDEVVKAKVTIEISSILQFTAAS